MSTEFINDQWRLPNEENKTKVSNYSMDFDGTSYITIQSSTELDNVPSNSHSFSFWFKSSAVGDVISEKKPTNNFLNSQYTIHLGSGYIQWYGGAGSVTGTQTSTTLNDNQWHHIVCVAESTTVNKIYVDGQLDVTSSANRINSAVVADNLVIGANYTGSYRYEGELDAFSIFNYALTDGTGGTVNQIAALYGSSSTGIGNPMSLSPKPVAYYPLGDQDSFNGSNYLVPNSSLKDYVFEIGAYPRLINAGTIADLNLNMAELSVSIWFKKTGGTRTSDYAILSKVGANNPTSFSLFWKRDQYATQGVNTAFKINNGSVQAVGGQSNTGNEVPITIEDNKWYNLVGTYNGTTQSLYINGVLHDFKSTTGNIVGVSGNALLGADSTASYYNWLGELSNTMIWTKGLNQAEVTTLYNNGSPIQTLSSIPQNSDLKVWYKLDASATYDGSNWTIEDSSSNSNDGTSSGMTQANLVQSDLSFTSGYSPYALDFDGASSDELNISNNISSLNNTSSYSYSFWYNPTVANYTTNLSVLGSYSKGLSYYHYSNGNLYIHTGTDLSSDHITLTTSNNINLNNWNNVVFTFINGSCVVYINGSAAGTYTNSSNSTSTNLGNSISIGWVRGYNENFGVKKISNVSIWNTNLTSSQVTEIYNEGVPSNLNNHSAYSNLVSWWQLGSNSSFNTNWTVLDEKGSNNGTSANMTEADIVDGVGSYANGLSSGMGGDEVIGDAPYSSSNSLSVNMDVLDRTEDTPA